MIVSMSRNIYLAMCQSLRIFEYSKPVSWKMCVCVEKELFCDNWEVKNCEKQRKAAVTRDNLRNIKMLYPQVFDIILLWIICRCPP